MFTLLGQTLPLGAPPILTRSPKLLGVPPAAQAFALFWTQQCPEPLSLGSVPACQPVSTKDASGFNGLSLSEQGEREKGARSQTPTGRGASRSIAAGRASQGPACASSPGESWLRTEETKDQNGDRFA